MKVSLCLVVWNELEGCRKDVPRLPRHAFDEVYAVDGGSTDGTTDYLESQGIPIYRQPKAGLNAAYAHAVAKSTGDAIVIFLSKGTTPPTDTLKFRPLFDAGYELVIASRNIHGARNEEDASRIKIRKWGVQCLSAVIALLWKQEGYRIHDVLHGFKGFTIEAFKRMNPSDQGLSIDLEMAVRSYQLCLNRIEFPTSEISRPYSRTHFPALPTGLKLLRYLISEIGRSWC